MRRTLTREEVEKWWNENMPNTLTSEELGMIEMYEEDDDLYVNVQMDDSRIEQARKELEEWLGTSIE